MKLKIFKKVAAVFCAAIMTTSAFGMSASALPPRGVSVYTNNNDGKKIYGFNYSSNLKNTLSYIRGQFQLIISNNSTLKNDMITQKTYKLLERIDEYFSQMGNISFNEYDGYLQYLKKLESIVKCYFEYSVDNGVNRQKEDNHRAVAKQIIQMLYSKLISVCIYVINNLN